jgi:ABC-type taurine transport system ATPase subunit
MGSISQKSRVRNAEQLRGGVMSLLGVARAVLSNPAFVLLVFTSLSGGAALFMLLLMRPS